MASPPAVPTRLLLPVSPMSTPRRTTGQRVGIGGRVIDRVTEILQPADRHPADRHGDAGRFDEAGHQFGVEAYPRPSARPRCRSRHHARPGTDSCRRHCRSSARYSPQCRGPRCSRRTRRSRSAGRSRLHIVPMPRTCPISCRMTLVQDAVREHAGDVGGIERPSRRAIGKPRPAAADQIRVRPVREYPPAPVDRLRSLASISRSSIVRLSEYCGLLTKMSVMSPTMICDHRAAACVKAA